MKYIFIVNPESAKGNAMKIIGNIEKVCKQEHIEYEVCYTLAQGDATRLAQSYKDDENIIYAVGGDGTLSEVLNGVIGTKNKIGIIPAGSSKRACQSRDRIRCWGGKWKILFKYCMCWN